MITKLQITGKLHYHRKCDFQLSKRKLGYRTLLPLTAPISKNNDFINLIYSIYDLKSSTIKSWSLTFTYKPLSLCVSYVPIKPNLTV